MFVILALIEEDTQNSLLAHMEELTFICDRFGQVERYLIVGAIILILSKLLPKYKYAVIDQSNLFASQN